MATTRRTARIKLVEAIEAYSAMCGRANWLNGYRAGNPAEEAQHYAEEGRRWKLAEEAMANVQKAITAFARTKG